MLKNKCFKCGAEWYPRTEKPLECPRCQSNKWNIKSDTRESTLEGDMNETSNSGIKE